MIRFVPNYNTVTTARSLIDTSIRSQMWLISLVPRFAIHPAIASENFSILAKFALCNLLTASILFNSSCRGTDARTDFMNQVTTNAGYKALQTTSEPLSNLAEELHIREKAAQLALKSGGEDASHLLINLATLQAKSDLTNKAVENASRAIAISPPTNEYPIFYVDDLINTLLAQKNFDQAEFLLQEAAKKADSVTRYGVKGHNAPAQYFLLFYFYVLRRNDVKASAICDRVFANKFNQESTPSADRFGGSSWFEEFGYVGHLLDATRNLASALVVGASVADEFKPAELFETNLDIFSARPRGGADPTLAKAILTKILTMQTHQLEPYDERLVKTFACLADVENMTGHVNEASKNCQEALEIVLRKSATPWKFEDLESRFLAMLEKHGDTAKLAQMKNLVSSIKAHTNEAEKLRILKAEAAIKAAEIQSKQRNNAAVTGVSGDGPVDPRQKAARKKALTVPSIAALGLDGLIEYIEPGYGLISGGTVDGKYEENIRAHRDFVSHTSDEGYIVSLSGKSFEGLADDYFDEGNLRQAYNCILAGLRCKLSSQNFELLGEYWYFTGDLKNSLQACEMALYMDPTNVTAAGLKVLVTAVSGASQFDTKSALDVLSKPDTYVYPSDRNAKVFVLMAQSKYPEAIAKINSTLSKHPDLWRMHNLRERCYKALGDAARAKDDLESMKVLEYRTTQNDFPR